MISLILKNVYRRRRTYFGYLLAATLSVATFLCFGFFVFHPGLSEQHLPDLIVQLIVAGELGIAVFAVFFVTFFHRFLLRLRGKEFGLLLAVGMSPRQLARLVWVESAILAAVACALGVPLGMIETFALFGAIGRILGTQPLDVAFPPQAVLYGAIFFALLFVADAALSARMTSTFTPKDLLASARSGQRAPSASIVKVFIGLASLAVAYALALVFSAEEAVAVASAVPIVVLCAVGTYLLFSQSLVLLLSIVRRRTASGLMLLGASRLTHRVLDYARILTVVALLSAAVLALLGVFTGALSYIGQIATSQVEYEELVREFSVALFVGFFLSFLCFIAAASTLYVKLFTQIDEDRRQLASLRRLGVSPKGLGSMLAWELAALFFAPVFIAIVHSAVAMGENTTRLAHFEGAALRGAWQAYALVVGGYSVIFLVCFLIARSTYRKRVMQDAIRRVQ